MPLPGIWMKISADPELLVKIWHPHIAAAGNLLRLPGWYVEGAACDVSGTPSRANAKLHAQTKLRLGTFFCFVLSILLLHLVRYQVGALLYLPMFLGYLVP